jgi:hypothetical protein
MTRTPYSDSSDDELDPETNDMSDTEQQSAWPYPGPRKTRESLQVQHSVVDAIQVELNQINSVLL